MIKEYEDKYESIWDDLVLNNSYNGNFLQTKRFLNYHPSDRFIDNSIMFFNEDKLVAVLPANLTEDGRELISHTGSTYGGIIIREDCCNTHNYNWIFRELLEYIEDKDFEKVEIRTSDWLYKPSKKRNALLDYYFQLNGFKDRKEIGFFIDLLSIDDDYESDFNSLRRRKLKKAYKQGLIFRELCDERDIIDFYSVLEDNMHKFDTVPVHTLEELLDFRFNRLKNEVSFYGVFREKELIAGSMVFNFCNKKVFHTQYLCSKQDALEHCPNEFLYTNLIKEAKNTGYRFLSYGTASLDHGNVYNENLGIYKEGFNTDTYMNTAYIWEKKDVR